MGSEIVAAGGSIAIGAVINKAIFGAVGSLPSLSWRQAAVASAVAVGVSFALAWAVK